MTTHVPDEDREPLHARDEVDELVAMISELAQYAETSSSVEPEVDPDEVAGASGQAQENRMIRLSQARFAAERTRLARDGLRELALRAQALTAELRAQRVLREARLELTAGERTMLADLWAVVPRYDRTRPVHGLVVELLGYARAVPGVAHAGITMWDRRRTVVWSEASDEVARALSAVQAVTGGPGRDAADTETPVHTGTRDDDHAAWHHFHDAAAELGVRAAFSVPVRDGVHVGSLDLHTRRPEGLDDRARALGKLLGRYTDIALRLRTETA